MDITRATGSGGWGSPAPKPQPKPPADPAPGSGGWGSTPKALAAPGSGGWGNPAPAPKLEPTSPDIVGPFFRDGSEVSDRLCEASEPGDKLILQGKVLDQSGNPVQGAKVDVWQADRTGAYDISDPADKDNPAFPMKFRAHQVTGPDGDFAFKTIRPGHYQIGENEWRTGHIHVKVNDGQHKDLTTQLYFPEDLMNPDNATSDLNDKDHWFDPKRVVDLVSNGNQWNQANYNIVMADK